LVRKFGGVLLNSHDFECFDGVHFAAQSSRLHARS
jgi:hypothetical protein